MMMRGSVGGNMYVRGIDFEGPGTTLCAVATWHLITRGILVAGAFRSAQTCCTQPLGVYEYKATEEAGCESAVGPVLSMHGFASGKQPTVMPGQVPVTKLSWKCGFEPGNTRSRRSYTACTCMDPKGYCGEHVFEGPR